MIVKSVSCRAPSIPEVSSQRLILLLPFLGEDRQDPKEQIQQIYEV